MPLTHRPYAGEADYQQMRDLLIQSYAPGGPAIYCSVGDLDWWCWGPSGTGDNPIDLAELWWDERDALAGFAWRNAPWGTDVQFDLLTHPRHPASRRDDAGLGRSTPARSARHSPALACYLSVCA